MSPLAPSILLAASLALGPEGPAAPTEDPLGPFRWLRHLAGACWTTTLPDGNTVDTQCYEVHLGRFLFGRISIGAASPAAGAAHTPPTVHAAGFQGEGLFAWDAKTGTIATSTWGSDGSFGTSEAFFEGELVHFPQASKTPGAPETRFTWKRLDADSYQVSRQRKDGETWKEQWAVVYRRVR